MKINVLDYGFVRFVEAYGHGDAGVGQEDKYGLVSPYPDMECGIVEAARQSTQANFRSWDAYKMCSKCGIWVNINAPDIPGCKATEDSHEWVDYKNGDKGLITSLYLNEPQHATPFEFAGAVIEVKAPIFVFREWMRHRSQSFNEMSARYAPLPNDNYLPTVERCMINCKKNRQAGVIKGADELTEINATLWLIKQKTMYEEFEKHYQDGLQLGFPKEVARIGMPVGRYSQMRAVANLRNWFAFMTLRDNPGAQWEIQMYTRAVGKILEDNFPKTYALFMEKKSPEYQIKKFTIEQLLKRLEELTGLDHTGR